MLTVWKSPQTDDNLICNNALIPDSWHHAKCIFQKSTVLNGSLKHGPTTGHLQLWCFHDCFYHFKYADIQLFRFKFFKLLPQIWQLFTAPTLQYAHYNTNINRKGKSRTCYGINHLVTSILSSSSVLCLAVTNQRSTTDWRIITLWNRLDAFLFDDIDGDGKWAKNGKADCQCNASLHGYIEPFMCINTFLGQCQKEGL